MKQIHTRAIWITAAIVCLTLPCTAAVGQSTDAKPAAAASPTFQLADIHPSPHSNNPFMRGGNLRGDQVIIRQATMVDLVAKAYGVENDNVLSGPPWLDTDRFDIVAKAPRTTSPDDVKLMLQALLKQRFNLVAHPDTHPLSTYVLRVDTAKGGSKLKQSAEDAGTPGCDETHTPTNPDGSLGHFITKCHNYPMGAIRSYIQGLGRQYILGKPVVDATGLKDAYDFTLEFTFQPVPGGLTIFDAVDKELGLKLTLENYPTPVLVVDSVNQKPTPNASGLDKALPPPPPAEFEVAVIKPAKPDEQLGLDVRGSQINITGLPLNFVIPWAWSLNPSDKEALVNAPKWLGDDHWDILGKMAQDPQAKAAPQFDFDDLQEMMRTLLQERFGLKSHMEERPKDAYTLVAVSPKLKKGDPMMRTGCKEGPGPDGKDPRIANPILGRLLTCTNITMAEFGDQLRILANGYIFYPVLDATGLTGGYDFTLSFSTAGQLQSAPKPPPSSDPNAAATSEPNGGLSLFDAINRQLGLKMEKVKRPEPVLVIDHVDEKPTDN
jgi:uncharacterized protein (TIGR03435 family)